MRGRSFAPYGFLVLFALATVDSASEAARNLVIATSPTVKDAIVALGHAFERSHEGVRVQVAVDTSLDLRRTIAGMENRGKAFIGSGPIHLERLVLVAPESLSEAPESLEALANMDAVRIAVADGTTRLGVETARLLSALRLNTQRLHVASDAAGILDHVLSGQADVGIMFGHDAARVQQRVRVLAEAPTALYQPVPHSIAMERYCPDRQLCQEFLRFVTSPAGQSVVKQLGYGPGQQPETPVTVSGQGSR
jgi:molybdate transport system substrate-binding protein